MVHIILGLSLLLNLVLILIYRQQRDITKRLMRDRIEEVEDWVDRNHELQKKLQELGYNY